MNIQFFGIYSIYSNSDINISKKFLKIKMDKENERSRDVHFYPSQDEIDEDDELAVTVPAAPRIS